MAGRRERRIGQGWRDPAGFSDRLEQEVLCNLPAIGNLSVTGHKDAIYALAFSPDGRTLATAGYDRVIHVWDVSDSGAIGKLPQPDA